MSDGVSGFSLDLMLFEERGAKQTSVWGTLQIDNCIYWQFWMWRCLAVGRIHFISICSTSNFWNLSLFVRFNSGRFGKFLIWKII